MASLTGFGTGKYGNPSKGGFRSFRWRKTPELLPGLSGFRGARPKLTGFPPTRAWKKAGVFRKGTGKFAVFQSGRNFRVFPVREFLVGGQLGVDARSPEGARP
jgi:hypothetical protein